MYYYVALSFSEECEILKMYIKSEDFSFFSLQVNKQQNLISTYLNHNLNLTSQVCMYLLTIFCEAFQNFLNIIDYLPLAHIVTNSTLTCQKCCYRLENLNQHFYSSHSSCTWKKNARKSTLYEAHTFIFSTFTYWHLIHSVSVGLLPTFLPKYF